MSIENTGKKRKNGLIKNKYSNMKLKYNIIPLMLMALLVISCGKKEAAAEKAPEKTEQKEQAHEEGPETIASLTEEQMRSVGVALGKV